MRVSTTALVAASAGSVLSQNVTTGQLGDAMVVTNNPIGQTYTGTLPEEPFFKAGSLDGNVKGSIVVKTGANGVGVDYTVKFSNLPKEGGPFPFHIHQSAVPSNGNCTATQAHLDPYVRGEDPVCDKDAPQTCQVGDLSGKYGKITSDPYELTFHDEFGSLNLGSNASIQDRSFVVHFANKTRISCANFAVSGYGNGTTSSVYPTGTGVSLPTTTSAGSAGGATGSGSATGTSAPISGANTLNAGASVAMVAFSAFAAFFF